jgi:hypothetical protein
MPFAARQIIEDPNDPKKKQPMTGGGSGVSQGLPGQEQKGPGSSGKYTNIQDYLKANQTQAAKMGTDIAGSVSKEAEGAKQKIAGVSAAAPKVSSYDPSLVIGKTDAGKVSAADKEAYQGIKKTGGYTGPQNIEGVAGYNEAQKATQGAAEKVKLAGSEYGQQELLKQQYGRPSYTAGQNKLDQMLLQGSQAGKTAMQNTKSKYENLENLFRTASQATGKAIGEAQKQALANKQAVAASEQKAWNDLTSQVQGRADVYNKQNPEIIKQVQKDVADAYLKEDTLKRLGLSAGQSIYDLDLANYLTPNQTQVGLNEAATAKERGKYQALADLFGDTTRNEITSEGKMINPISFNQEQFAKDLAGKEAERKDILTSRSGIVNAVNSPVYVQTINGQKIPGKKTFNDIGGDLSKMSLPQIESTWLPKMKDYVSKLVKQEEQAKKNDPRYIPQFDLSKAQSVISEVEKQVSAIKNDKTANRKILKEGSASIIQPTRGQSMPKGL